MAERPPFEQFFAHRRFYAVAELTPDGERVLFVSNISGQFNLWSVPVEGGWPEQLTTFTDRSVRGVAVASDGTIVFTADRDGDEFTQLFRIPAGGGWPEQLTDLERVQHAVSPGAFVPDASRFVFSANSRRPQDGEIFVWDGEGEPRHLFGENMYAFGINVSPDGAKVQAVDFRSNTDSTVHVVDLDTGEAAELTPHEGEVRFLPGPWAADGSGFYLLTDEGREFQGLTFQPLDGSREWVETPDRDVDEVAGSADGRVLAWVENADGWSHVRLRDLVSGHDLPAPKLPPGTASMLGSGLALTRDGSRLALVWDQPARPAEVYVVETATGEARAGRSSGQTSAAFRCSYRTPVASSS